MPGSSAKPADAFTRDARMPGTKPEDVVVGHEPKLLGHDGFVGAGYESVRGVDKAKSTFGHAWPSCRVRGVVMEGDRP